MNFLETLICLTLIAILAGIGSFGYQSLLIRTELEADRALVKLSLEQGRGEGGEVRCMQTHCEIVSQKGKTRRDLSGKHQVVTQLFPQSAQGTFSFTPSGLTSYRNGTISIFPPNHPEMVKKIVVSQGGRIR